MSNVYDPTVVQSGQTLYDDNGKPHIVDYPMGNYIFCTDGWVYDSIKEKWMK